MKKFYLTGAAAVAALMAAAPAAAAPNLIVNGGFQTGVVNNGGFATISAVSSAITGWKVTGGSVDLITGYWQGANGTFASVDMAGNSNGTIEQTIATQIGKVYRLVFYKSANPDGFDADRVVKVAVTGAPVTNFTYDAGQGQTISNMKWQKTGMLFTATNTATTVAFSAFGPNAGNAGNGYYGLALDGVSVTATPEPEAFASILVGLGLAGFVARRRRAKAAAVAA